MDNRREAPEKRFKTANLPCMAETKDKAVPGWDMRNKYTIPEFLWGSSYGEGLPFEIRRPVASSGCEVILCVVFRSADPKVRDIVDFDDYVFSRATEVR